MIRSRRQSGFSLIELITVVVLIGLLATAGGLLLLNPIEAYDDQVRRQQLVDQGEMALRQIARDVRRALPNSLRETPVGTGSAIEMVNTVDGARYRDEIGGVDYIDNIHVLDFISPDDQFNLLGLLELADAGELASGDQRLVIYNTSDDIYTEAVDTLDYEGIITREDMSLTLTTPNPGPDDDEANILMSDFFLFTQQSPGQRAYIVDGPISYVCDPTTSQMLRYSGYDYRVTQPTASGDFTGPSTEVGTVISQLTFCSMTYDDGTSERGGILTVEITITNSGESVSLLHQIHVQNVP